LDGHHPDRLILVARLTAGLHHSASKREGFWQLKEKEQPERRNDFPGVHWLTPNRASVSYTVQGRTISFGSYWDHDLERGLRLYDSAQFLFRGARASSSLGWEEYSQADVKGVAHFLRSKGLDVELAVARSFGAKGARLPIGVRSGTGGSWTASVVCPKTEHYHAVTLLWKGLPDVAAATRQLDLALVAVFGLDSTPNLTASSYSKEDLAEAGREAASQGVAEHSVKASLAAVEKVCACSVHGWRGARPCCACDAACLRSSLAVDSLDQTWSICNSAVCAGSGWCSDVMYCVVASSLVD
jgi:hypothetical protein